MAEAAGLSYAERRARREERRAKQREANVGRAQKMRAARRLYEAEVRDRNVPDSRQECLHRHRNATKGRSECLTQADQCCFIGCSGWYYWHWKGLFYPQDIPGSQWFAHYARHFKTVELNAPFYSWPTVGTVRTWIRQAGRRQFIYTVKVSELITHTKRFVGTKQLVRDFCFIADLLGERMGCFLFQLPPSFHYTPPRLRTIVSQLDARRRNVVEFRHRSWWNEAVYSAFRDHGITFCSTSGPRLPDELIETSDDIYIRFHGTKRWYRHDYTKDELAVWTRRICQSGATRVWAYFNNDREGNAIRNAKELARQLKKSGASITSMS